MGLLRDWTYIEKATQIPALSEMIREALIRDLFTRNDRVLPREIIRDLARAPAVTVRVKDDGEVRKLLQVLNGEESTLSLGLSGEDYNYFRTQLGVGKDREIGLTVRPAVLLTYDWIVPEQRGVQLDFSGYTGIEFPKAAHVSVAKVGTRWKTLYDEAFAHGHRLPVVPTVPLDFAVGDALWAEAPLAAYDGEISAYVNALRTISAYGHRTRVGFEEVVNNGTAYDVLRGTELRATEFYVPLEVAIRLRANPPARRTLTYSYDDAGKVSAALDKLTRSLARPEWVHITDQGGAQTLRTGTAPFTVQVSMAGTASGLPGQGKALEGLLAGFTAKAEDIPSPFDAPADAYGKTANRIAQGLFIGEVRLPAAGFGDLVNRLRSLAQQAATKVSLYATARSSGTLSLFPSFDLPPDRVRIYDLSKGLQKLVDGVPGAVFVSRLAHLWREDGEYVTRIELLRTLKLSFDTAHVLEPLVAP